jgi:hypothetical protein
MLLLGWLVVIRSAGAQEAPSPLPEFRMPPPALGEVEPYPEGVIPPGESVPGAIPEGSPFQVGPVTLRPHFYYRFLYVSRVLSSPGQTQSTTVQDIAPGLLSVIGRHWMLDYTPYWILYSNPQFRDRFHQSVQLRGETTYENWVLALSQGYVSYAPLLIETARQTGLETYSTTLRAEDRVNKKMLLEFTGSQNFRFAPGFTDTREWSTHDWLNYQFWPRFTASLGGGLGYVNVQPGFDQTYEQYQGRVRWRLTDKIGFEVEGGVEDRQSTAPGAAARINWIGRAEVQYQPSEVTTLSLRVGRHVATSFFTNQVVEVTSFGGILNQRLLEKLSLNVEGGYAMPTYVAVANGANAGRRDKIYYVNTTLSYPFLKRGTISFLYLINNNDSNRSEFRFSSNRVGFEIGYRY